MQKFFSTESSSGPQPLSSRNQDLKKTSWTKGGKSVGPQMESLDESDDGRKYNQFEGRKSTYHENLYTTKLDES